MLEAQIRRRERDNVTLALESADGNVHGPFGAAELLGLKSNTLALSVKKMRLDR